MERIVNHTRSDDGGEGERAAAACLPDGHNAESEWEYSMRDPELSQLFNGAFA